MSIRPCVNSIRARTSRFAIVVACTSLLGACMAIEPPRLGSGPPVVSPTQLLVFGRAPITGEAARFAFLNITGAPSGLVNDLEKALQTEAEARRVVLVPEGDLTATYQIRGYLSAIGDSHSTLLVYVWDVLDMSGKRLHRITGQEPGGGSGTDPWLGIDSMAMRAAAQRTIDGLADWIAPR